MLFQGAAELGVELAPEQVSLFMSYLDTLELWNRRVSLTSLKGEKEIIVNHFLDSITAASLIRGDSKLLDIGSGAGFPGVPLKIVIPSLDVTLLDSVHKKVMFMKELVRVLGLSDTRAVCGRAEDEYNGIERGVFDFVITRAVGAIPEIVKLSDPYLPTKGRIVIMRGRRGDEEWESAEPALREKFRLVERKAFRLPLGGHSRVIFALERSDCS